MVRLYWLCIALLLSWEYFCSVFYDLPCLQLPGQSGSMGHQKKNGKMFVRNDVVPNWDEKPQRHIIFLCCKNLGCPLHSSSYMDFKVHMLRDISYSTCIKSMKTKPVITLIFLSSPQVYTKKVGWCPKQPAKLHPLTLGNYKVHPPSPRVVPSRYMVSWDRNCLLVV